jgi:nuclear transport factor 2 (NTF2) superfamily protein
MIGNYKPDGSTVTARHIAESSRNSRANGKSIEEQRAAVHRESIAREKQKMREFLRRQWQEEHPENGDE